MAENLPQIVLTDSQTFKGDNIKVLVMVLIVFTISVIVLALLMERMQTPSKETVVIEEVEQDNDFVPVSNENIQTEHMVGDSRKALKDDDTFSFQADCDEQVDLRKSKKKKKKVKRCKKVDLEENLEKGYELMED